MSKQGQSTKGSMCKGRTSVGQEERQISLNRERTIAKDWHRGLTAPLTTSTSLWSVRPVGCSPTTSPGSSGSWTLMSVFRDSDHQPRCRRFGPSKVLELGFSLHTQEKVGVEAIMIHWSLSHLDRSSGAVRTSSTFKAMQPLLIRDTVSWDGSELTPGDLEVRSHYRQVHPVHIVLPEHGVLPPQRFVDDTAAVGWNQQHQAQGDAAGSQEASRVLTCHWACSLVSLKSSLTVIYFSGVD